MCGVPAAEGSVSSVALSAVSEGGMSDEPVAVSFVIRGWSMSGLRVSERLGR